MSVSCKGFVGYTVTLKEYLTSKDFDFFINFTDTHPEYNQFDCKDKVLLTIDGMNGEYARLIFVDEKINECWVEGKDYFNLRSDKPPKNIYDELNKAYKLMYNKELDVNSVNYALWFQFT